MSNDTMIGMEEPKRIADEMARELRDLRRREAEICRALNGEPKAPPPLVVPGVCVISYALQD